MTTVKKTISEIVSLVKPAGNSGRIYLPKDWVGKYVRVTITNEVKK